MELRLLKYFLAVADAGSVTRAAGDVRVAQPSLSRQLRQLEAELDTALFDRSQGRLRLTAAGTRFVPIARDLMARAQTAETTMRSLADNRDVGLVVAASATTIVDVIAPFIAMSGSDGAIVNVFEDLPNHVYAALTNSAADLAVTTSPAPSNLESRLVFRASIWAYVATDHAWSGRGAVDLAELVQEPLIVLDETHGTRRLLDQVVAAAGLQYDVVREVGAPQIAHALAAAGHGVAVLSDDPRYGLTPMSIGTSAGPLVIPLFAAWDRTHYARVTIERCVQEMSTFCQTRYST
jgi:DNA-binding transcriptional LysR family regulator